MATVKQTIMQQINGIKQIEAVIFKCCDSEARMGKIAQLHRKEWDKLIVMIAQAIPDAANDNKKEG